MSVLSTLQFIMHHPLAAKAPAGALWRYVNWQVKSRIREEMIVNWIGGVKVIARRGMTGMTGNIYCGLHECSDMAFFLHLLRQEDLFIDVGANVGSYTIIASAVCGASVLAFEPDPGTAALLRRNVELNGVGGRVTVTIAAVGSASGTIKFTTGRDTTNRVAEAGDASAQEVPIVALDVVAGGLSPTALKIDVEGYEPQVVAGAIDTLRNPSLQAIIIESIDDYIVSQLRDAGFTRVHYDPFDRKLSTLGADIGQASANSLFVKDIEYCQARVSNAIYRSVYGSMI